MSIDTLSFVSYGSFAAKHERAIARVVCDGDYLQCTCMVEREGLRILDTEKMDFSAIQDTLLVIGVRVCGKGDDDGALVCTTKDATTPVSDIYSEKVDKYISDVFQISPDFSHILVAC